jgi:hypothetical protein
MRKFLATTAAGLALATGSVAVATFTPIGSAFAQTGTTQTAPAQGGDAAKQGHPRVRQLAKAAVKDAAGVIGISPADLAKELKDGKSIADVATAHNVSPQAVIDKLVADANAKVDAAVAAGKITQEKGDAAKAKMPERVTKLVNKHFDGSHRPGAQK